MQIKVPLGQNRTGTACLFRNGVNLGPCFEATLPDTLISLERRSWYQFSAYQDAGVTDPGDLDPYQEYVAGFEELSQAIFTGAVYDLRVIDDGNGAVVGKLGDFSYQYYDPDTMSYTMLQTRIVMQRN